jgi:hypothetical protein
MNARVVVNAYRMPTENVCRGEMLVAEGRRRERNWDPTFSEFVGRQLAGGVTLKSDRLIENTREFHTIQHIGLPSAPPIASTPDSEQFRFAPRTSGYPASYSPRHSGYGDGNGATLCWTCDGAS